MPRTPRQKLPTAKPKHIEPWPEGQRSPEEVADEAIYVGSPEHKHYTNPVNDETPAPRGVSSATLCDAYPAEMWCRFTVLLRAAIRHRCTSADFDAGGWPRDVWGWCEGRLFRPRHRTHPVNAYKAYFIPEEQRPRDREGRLLQLKSYIESLDD
jgi:hypothetical protein